VTLNDLATFRQAGSRCPGHPEYGVTTGVETTTGPLGQGASTSVGMALAQRWLAATYNRPDFILFDFRVFALCGTPTKPPRLIAAFSACGTGRRH
jgi:transketolase